ncbi:MAG: hypothetical protein LBC59_01640 [Chitinispirillales bacterium]|jgi:hypothetical protein|nr:hypothetical protein [Chitinispirillales bacterium]
MPLKRFAAAWFAVAACFFGGCVVDGPLPDDTPDTSIDARFTGTWQTIYDDDDGTGIEITNLAGTGDLIEGGFLRVGNYWIESWLNTGTWRVSNDTLFEVIDGDTLPLRYMFSNSGNRLTLVFCERGSCYENIADKVDVAAVKSNLGTVYGQDLALYVSESYTDLMWRLEEDEYETIDFDIMYFYDGQRYFGDDWYYDDYDGCYYHGEDEWDEWYDPVWYTTGSRLFLVLTNGIEAEETVELKYEVIGGGSAAKLLISPVLPDGTLLTEEDTWLPAEYDDWGWGFNKSRYGKKAAKSRKGLFTKRKEDRRRHVWNSSVHRR